MGGAVRISPVPDVVPIRVLASTTFTADQIIDTAMVPCRGARQVIFVLSGASGTFNATASTGVQGLYKVTPTSTLRVGWGDGDQVQVNMASQTAADGQSCVNGVVVSFLPSGAIGTTTTPITPVRLGVESIGLRIKSSATPVLTNLIVDAYVYYE